MLDQLTTDGLTEFSNNVAPVAAQFAWWFFGWCCMVTLCIAGTLIRSIRIADGASTEL